MNISIVLFVAVLVNLHISITETKLANSNSLEVSHKLVKRHCSCVASSCNCAALTVIFQMPCTCPQICNCGKPSAGQAHVHGKSSSGQVHVYPNFLPHATLPPITLPPAPVTTTTTPNIPSYCCIMFICSICSR